jgi:hypothetical protein
MNELAKLSRVEAEKMMIDLIYQIGGISPDELADFILPRVEAERAINNVKEDIISKKQFYTQTTDLLKVERFALKLIKHKDHDME